MADPAAATRGIRSRRWWPAVVSAVRGVGTVAAILAVYYLVPLDADDATASTFAVLGVGLLVFSALMTWQLRAITRSDNPGLRALEGLFLAVPMFLLLFASVYVSMSQTDAAAFDEPLDHTGALYFSVTIFSTVGFGDITPATSAARLVVSAQMILDLVLLGLGVRIILEAVQRGRERLGVDDEPDEAPARAT